MNLEENSQEDQPRSEITPDPLPLSYQSRNSPHYSKGESSFRRQVSGGFTAWIGAVVFVLFTENSKIWTDAFAKQSVKVSIVVVLALLAGLAVWLRLKHRNRGFLVGVLIGFGVTCLIPIGILTVICGPHFRL